MSYRPLGERQWISLKMAMASPEVVTTDALAITDSCRAMLLAVKKSRKSNGMTNLECLHRVALPGQLVLWDVEPHLGKHHRSVVVL